MEQVLPRLKRQKQRPEKLEKNERDDDSPSLNAKPFTDGRSRKVSIGLSVSSSKSRARTPAIDRNPGLPFLRLPELENDRVLKSQINGPPSNPQETVLNIGEEISCSRRKWTSLDNPIQAAIVHYNACTSSPPKAQIASACNRNPASRLSNNNNARFVADNASLSSEEIPSTKFVQVYEKRKSSVRMGQAFDATRESTLIRYQRKRNKDEDKEILKEFAFEKTEEVKSCKRQIAGHVRFSFGGDPNSNPNPNPVWNKSNKVNNNSKDSNQIALRMKLRNVLGSIYSSQKLDCHEENIGREEAKSKSDTIETDSEEPNRIANPVMGAAPAHTRRIMTRTNAKSLNQGDPQQTQVNMPNPRAFCTNDYSKRDCFSSTPSPAPADAGNIFSFDEEAENANQFSGKRYNRKFTRKHEDSDQNSLASLREERSDHSPPEKLPSTVPEIPVQITDLNELVDANTWMLDKEKTPSPSPSGHEDKNVPALPVKEEMRLFIEAESKGQSSRVSFYKSPREPPNEIRSRPRIKRRARELSLSPYSKEESDEGTDSEPYAMPSEEDHTSDLFGAVKQLAIILKKFKQKVIIERNMKASQILECASETIHNELLKIESQIQSDLVKYTDICKTKYRHLETNLQDMNGKLKLIHEQFRNDVAHHLQLYTNTLSQIEGEQIELKSICERQKVSHRKLLSQAEELIESQLADAEGKIATVHKVARSNLLGLKHVLGEYFG